MSQANGNIYLLTAQPPALAFVSDLIHRFLRAGSSREVILAGALTQHRSRHRLCNCPPNQYSTRAGTKLAITGSFISNFERQPNSHHESFGDSHIPTPAHKVTPKICLCCVWRCIYKHRRALYSCCLIPLSATDCCSPHQR